MGKKLSEAEINRRLVKLRNLERLHAGWRAVLKAKDEEIAALKTRVEEIAPLKAELKDQAVLIAELRQAVFGRKRRSPGPAPVAAAPKPAEPRSKASYRRPLPEPTDITDERKLSLATACACGGRLRKVKEAVRYEEDIPLPDLTPEHKGKLVIEYFVEKGVCLACGKAKTAEGFDLSGQKVRLGRNVRLAICHLIASGSSYAQVRRLLETFHGLKVSSGEIAAVLREKHRAWRPAYQSLLANIRSSPVVHVDETPWPVRNLAGAGHAWIVSSPDNLACLALRNGRGGAHARELLAGFEGLRITDNYAAYSNQSLAGRHQLCWAHLYRNIRDLRYNQNLAADQAGYVAGWYEGFAGLYAGLRQCLTEPAPAAVRSKQAAGLTKRLNHLLASRPGRSGEPAKLTRLKHQLRKASEAGKLFACLEANAPCDNNRAERDLRPLVIKRKNSFGSVSEAGASALATVISLCTNTWRTNKDNYFQALAALG